MAENGLAALLAARKAASNATSPVEPVSALGDHRALSSAGVTDRGTQVVGVVVTDTPKRTGFFGAGNRIAAATAPEPSSARMVESSEEMNLDDLNNLEDEGISPTTTHMSQFDDETPATKPTRELPADADKGLLQFIDLIDGVYGIIGDSELLGNVIRSIMIELKSNPQYMKQVSKEDIRQWVRAMRDSMGLARIKKQEKAKPRSGAAKGKSKVTDSDMADAMKDLGIDMSDL